jgi:hypothetical protein
MIGYALRRLLGLVPLLLLVLFLAFVFMRTAPGGPFDSERNLSPQIEQALRARYHLDEPVLRQFGRYLGDLAHGDLGPSFRYRGARWRRSSRDRPDLARARRAGDRLALPPRAGSRCGPRPHRGTIWRWGSRWRDHCIPNFVLGPVLVLVLR